MIGAPPTPAYGVADIFFYKGHSSEGDRYWMITDVYYNDLISTYSYYLDDMDGDCYWEHERIIDLWFVRAA